MKGMDAILIDPVGAVFDYLYIITLFIDIFLQFSNGAV
jgi:hypothetical protein